jgi:superfamily II DNA or RNA helicase
MPREVSVKVQGLCCTFPKGIIEGDLTARTEVKERIHSGINRGRFKSRTSYDPVYFEGDKDTIACGIGAIIFLAKNNPLVSINFSSIEPKRNPLSKIEIPPQLLSSPKFSVGGKRRWYFYEGLEACRKTHCGTIKLPTGSGKTAIALTLAYNQATQLGTGIIIVPSNTIKDQFIKSAKEFGIRIADYRDWVNNSDSEVVNDAFPQILITHPTVLYNDILEVRKWIVHKAKEDMRSVMYKHHGINWIIGDEIHHAGCETWITIFLGLRNLTRSHGFSALPVEESSELAINFAGMSIEDAMTISIVGPVIYEKSTKELKDFLNIPKLINLKYEWPKNKWADQKTDDWQAIRALMKVNEERTALIAMIIRLLIDRDYNTIVHVAEKEFGLELFKKVDSPRCACWYGGKDTLTDKGRVPVEKLRQQAGSEIVAMICTSHAVEGLDLDSPLNAIVLIDGRKPRQILQKCGRITRPGKPSVVINLVDRGLWVLPKHSEERRKVIQEEFDSDSYDVNSLAELVTVLNLIESNSMKDDTHEEEGSISLRDHST